MSFQSLLTDRCDLYYHREKTKSATYGIPGEPEYYYAETPDVTNVLSYWTKTEVIVRTRDVEPMNITEERFKVSFHITADIRDLTKATFNGREYVLRNPVKIKNHHIECVAEKLTF